MAITAVIFFVIHNDVKGLPQTVAILLDIWYNFFDYIYFWFMVWSILNKQNCLV